jgi:hypothetical protein
MLTLVMSSVMAMLSDIVSYLELTWMASFLSIISNNHKSSLWCGMRTNAIHLDMKEKRTQSSNANDSMYSQADWIE